MRVLESKVERAAERARESYRKVYACVKEDPKIKSSKPKKPFKSNGIIGDDTN